MQKNLNFQWDEQVKRLQKDAGFAKKFTKFILADMLQEQIEVESVSVHVQKGADSKGDGLELVAAIVAHGVKRNLKICLNKDRHLEYSQSFTCCYYCVESPAILLDSGMTKVNLAVREDLLERWNSFNV